MRLALGLAAALVGLAANASAVSCPVDVDTLRCQQGVGRAGSVYVRAKMKAVQQCLNKIQDGTLAGDPVTVCRGTTGVPPTDATTAAKIARAETRVADILAAKCSDALVATLELCATTVSGLATCLVVDHWGRTDAAIAEEYGALAQTGDPGEQACQARIAKEAGKYLAARTKAIARCIDARNRTKCTSSDPLPNCIQPSLDGPRAEKAAANKIARAEAKMRDKIGGECSDPEITALDACADTGTPLADCLVCTHNNAAGLLLAGQYEAVHAANPTGPSLQSIADAADDGDTIFVEPGTYTQSVELKDSDLSVIGIKTPCDAITGARPIIENPDPGGAGSLDNGIFSCGSLSGACTNVADRLLLQGLEVNDFLINDVLTFGAEGVTYRDMVTRGFVYPNPDDPGEFLGTEYGVFPILSNNVIVEYSVVTGVRDAGIYVGQSTNIVVRHNEVYGNVAGIEIENSANAEVHHNNAHDNTAGILVFRLILPVDLSQCHYFHDNISANNNLDNFGSGLVGDVPRGTGMLVLSNHTTRFENNTISGNKTFGIVVTDQTALNALFGGFPTPSPYQDVEYNHFVGNVFSGNASDPAAGFGAFAADGTFVVTGGSPEPSNCGDHIAPDADPYPESYFWNTLTEPCPDPAVLPGCPYETTTSTTATSTTTSTTFPASWAAIQGVFSGTCGGCHGFGASGNLTGLNDCNTGWTNLVNVPAFRAGVMQDRVEPGDSTMSFLMRKLDNNLVEPPDGDSMPYQQPLLSIEFRDAVRTWIDDGALNDCP